MNTLTAKQTKQIEKAEKMIREANEILEANLRSLDHNICVAQLLSRINKVAQTESILNSSICNKY
jgi:hypothetical protein